MMSLRCRGYGHIASMQFNDLPLHDATLSGIDVRYDDARCTLQLSSMEGVLQLAFEGFQCLTFPRREPWGRSCSVNSARQISAKAYELELQSGDVIRIEAERWELGPPVSALPGLTAE